MKITMEFEQLREEFRKREQRIVQLEKDIHLRDVKIHNMRESYLSRAAERSREYAQTSEERVKSTEALREYSQKLEAERDALRGERDELHKQFEAACRGSRWVSSAAFQAEHTNFARAAEESRQYAQTLEEVLRCERVHLRSCSDLIASSNKQIAAERDKLKALLKDVLCSTETTDATDDSLCRLVRPETLERICEALK